MTTASSGGTNNSARVGSCFGERGDTDSACFVTSQATGGSEVLPEVRLGPLAGGWVGAVLVFIVDSNVGRPKGVSKTYRAIA